MNPWLIPFALPTYLQTLVILVLGLPFYRRPWLRGGGMLWVTWRPWFARRWRYTTTLGLVCATHDIKAVSKRLFEHERIHGTRQYVDENVKGLILGGLVAIVDWRWGLGIYLSSGMLWLSPNFFTGWVRFGDAYRGSEHEKSAYAQTEHLR